MTAYCPTYQGNNGLAKLIVIMTLLAIATVALMMHANLTHPAGEAETVRQCISNHGVMQLWELGNKQFRVCELQPGTYGIQVILKDAQGAWREVTSFVRSTHGKPANLDKVMQYLERLGAIMK
jgi:hypothetical protein